MSKKNKIPFNKISINGNEIKYVKNVLESGHTSGDGYYTKKCQDFLEKELRVPKTLLTTSCTHALEMAGILLDIGPGDEVILPSFTFVSTVNAFVLQGAKPIFLDIKSDTLNIDETQIESKINKNTKAIIVVHYAGVGCEMNAIMEISKKYDIPVIEDNALGLFGKYNDKYLGTFGTFATQSFHETKSFSCGEGGALIINDKKYIEKAEIIREKGTDRSRFKRGFVDKYTWVSKGSSYLLSDILSAILYSNLENWIDVQEKRKNIWYAYFDGISDWSSINNISLPQVPKHCNQSYAMFYVLTSSSKKQNKLINELFNMGISAFFHYLPLHLSKMGKTYGSKVREYPVTEKASKCLVRLPFFDSLNQEDQQKVIKSIIKINL
tara:strand:+ start:13979 stop:15121 length:1143 start_codon:yes stop_codon:yes gene_type:complete